MTRDAAWRLPEALPAGATALSSWVGVCVLAVLVVALAAKVALQSRPRPASRNVFRLLDAVIAPLLIAFIAIVIERFRDLS